MRTRHPIDKDTASPGLRRLLLAVFILATKKADGTIEAGRLVAGKDGVDPPM